MTTPLRTYAGLLRAGLLPLLILALLPLAACGDSGSASDESGERIAPDFNLPAARGSTASLDDLLANRDAAVIVFYRGFF